MWTLATCPLDGDTLVLDSCWATDRNEFLIVGSKSWHGFGSIGKSMATSPDGIIWTYRNSPVDSPPASNYGGNINAVVRCNSLGLYIAVGSILESSSFFSGSFVTAGVMTSPDGITWMIPHAPAYNTTQTNPWLDPLLGNSGESGRCIACKQSTGLLIAGGSQPAFTGSYSNIPALQKSTDGINWTGLPSPLDVNVGGYGVAYSIDYSPNENVWIAHGYSSDIISYNDGVTWTVLPLIDIYSGQKLVRMDSQGKWFVLGGTTYATKLQVSINDGTSWSSVDPMTGSPKDIIDVGGNLLAIGSINPQIVASPDGGITWVADSVTPTPFYYTQSVTSLSYSPTLNLAIATSGRIRTVAYGLPVATRNFKRILGYVKDGVWNLTSASGPQVGYYYNGQWRIAGDSPNYSENGLGVYKDGVWRQTLELDS